MGLYTALSGEKCVLKVATSGFYRVFLNGEFVVGVKPEKYRRHRSLYDMADCTGTLWENTYDKASCNHGFASYAAIFLLEAEKHLNK